MTTVRVSVTRIGYFPGEGGGLTTWRKLYLYRGDPGQSAILIGAEHATQAKTLTLMYYQPDYEFFEGDIVYSGTPVATEIRADLQARYGRWQETKADPLRLMPPTFTIRELRRLHEAIWQYPLPKDSFRRWVIDQLVPVAPAQSNGKAGRPAELFTLREDTA